jgi:hypothetical protein
VIVARPDGRLPEVRLRWKTGTISERLSQNAQIILLNLIPVRTFGMLIYTRKIAQVVAILMKTGLNNVLLPTLFTVVNNIVTPDSCSTILLNIVHKCEQRGQQNIVQSC